MAKWTEDKILAEALNYETRAQFHDHGTAARRHKRGLDFFCQHMTPQNESWTAEKIIRVALQYESVREFRSRNIAAYTAAIRYNVLEQCKAHMKDKLSQVDRYIYAIEGEEKSIYIGLSSNPRRRYAEHKRRGRKAIKDLIKSTHTFKIVVGPVSQIDAQNMEDELIRHFKARGYNVLNQVAAGALGSLGAIKWTEDAIYKEARQYTSRTEFLRGSPGAYGAARRQYGSVDRFCKHMEPKLKSWDEASIAEEALKYKNRGAFEKACGAAVQAARRLGIWEKVCAHMPYLKLPNGYWSNRPRASVVA
ncbi:GIY-YIG nuclease family protein [Brucella tritici]|uniref:GIY-YIG nuclease family protein n=1 Tax=Brucella tritici TaxID=94626 RepID=UPI002000E73E|nr:GIY-YIG nuclease family protein [Brucella tritici]